MLDIFMYYTPPLFLSNCFAGFQSILVTFVENHTLTLCILVTPKCVPNNEDPDEMLHM